MSNADYQFLMRDLEPSLVAYPEDAKAFCQDKIDRFFQFFRISMKDEEPTFELQSVHEHGEDSDWMHMVLGRATPKLMSRKVSAENLVVITLWHVFFIRDEDQDPATASDLLYPALNTVIWGYGAPLSERLMEMDWRLLMQHPPQIGDEEEIDYYDTRCQDWFQYQMDQQQQRQHDPASGGGVIRTGTFTAQGLGDAVYDDNGWTIGYENTGNSVTDREANALEFDGLGASLVGMGIPQPWMTGDPDGERILNQDGVRMETRVMPYQRTRLLENIEVHMSLVDPDEQYGGHGPQGD